MIRVAPLCVVALLLACASAKVISGDIVTVQTNIGFIGHFAFSKQPDPAQNAGEFFVALHAADVNKAQNLVLYAYDDEDYSWPAGASGLKFTS